MSKTSPAAPLGEEDYLAIERVLRETERGRGFLHEYARRHAAPDAETLLNAIARLERAIAAQAGALVEPVDNLQTVGIARETAAAVLEELRSSAATLGAVPEGSATTPMRRAMIDQGTALRDAVRRLQGAHGKLRAEGAARDEIKGVVDTLKDLSERQIALAHTLSTAIDGLDRLLDTIGEPDETADAAEADPAETAAAETPPSRASTGEDGGIVIIRTPASSEDHAETGDEPAQPALDLDSGNASD